MSITIVRPKWDWNGTLYRRNGKPKGVVEHHAAASSCTAQDIDRWHKDNGWTGIGYHYFISKKGVITKGRPDWALGAHCLGATEWIGICHEGNFDREKMPAAQKNASIALRKHLNSKFGKRVYKRHRDMPGNSTACPGRNFPFKDITGT